MHSAIHRADALLNALNDRSCTQIGDPWKGTYHIAIDVSDADTHELLAELEALGVTYQVNPGIRDRIAIYEPDSIERLLQLGDRLEPRVLERLETLVRARAPVPAATANRIQAYLSMGKDPAWIAARMNERRVTAGMGGKGWTPRKVKAAARGQVPARLRKREGA